MLKNDLFLKALNGETVNRPPVWMMRQAGRYLPDFMKLKAKYEFFTRCQTPELATEITIMPIDQIGPDAAILFSVFQGCIFFMNDRNSSVQTEKPPFEV